MWPPHANLAPRPFSTAQSDDELIEEFLAGKSRRTQKAYRRDLTYLRAFLADREITTLTAATPSELRAYQEALRSMPALDNKGLPTEKTLAHNSQVRRLQSVRSFFKYAIETSVIMRDPSASLKIPAPHDKTTERIISMSEVLKMIALEPSDRNRVMIRLLYDTGIRASELVAIAWDDFRVGDRGTRLTVIGKGNKLRTIFLHPEMWRQLEIHKTLTHGQPSDRPFGLSTETVRTIVGAAADRAGVERKVSTHWLRHCCATHSIQNKADIGVVQATLGHASLATTTKYIHADPNDSAGMYLPR